MTLIESIQRVPIAVETAQGQELAADWGASGALAEVLTGIGGCSPYLCDLLRQEKDWLAEAVTLAAPLQNLLPSDVSADIGADLRRAKRRVAGFLAMAEISGAYSLAQSTQALTGFADQAVSLAFQAALAPYQASGKLPEETGLFVIAMGKMGAEELNYSSDIDLVVMFDDRDMDHFEAAQRRQILVRATRAATKLLNDITEHGYVFRTDLRLRPDPSVTPICVAMGSALDYYESLGRTWERAAFIKARICAGDRRAGAEFLDQMKPFVWRRYLDFAAIEEAHALRLKIRTKTGARGAIKVPGHDIKLGRGGIREIEFFTQTRAAHLWGTGCGVAIVPNTCGIGPTGSKRLDHRGHQEPIAAQLSNFAAHGTRRSNDPRCANPKRSRIGCGNWACCGIVGAVRT